MEIKTSCEGCVFLQKGNCYLGRHENFVKNGASVELVDNIPVINGRFCSAKRFSEWAEGTNRMVQRENKVRSEILIGTHVFIHTDNWSWLGIEKTYLSLKKQLLKPTGITIVGTKENFKERFLDRYAKVGGIKVAIDNKYNKYQCLDTAIDNCQSYFYILVDAGAVFNRNFLANIDDSINHRLEQFSFIAGEGKFCYGSSIDLHKELNGNKPGYLNLGGEEILFATSSLETKVRYLAKAQNNESFIRNYADFQYDN